MKLNVSNSVYQNGYNGGGSGLTVRGGRLINERPDSVMGIVQVSNAVRERKNEQKIQSKADAIVRAHSMMEMNKMMGDMDCCM